MVDSLGFLLLYESCEDKEDCGSTQDWADHQEVLPVVLLLVDLQIDLLTHTDHLLLLLLNRLIVGWPAVSEM